MQPLYLSPRQQVAIISLENTLQQRIYLIPSQEEQANPGQLKKWMRFTSSAAFQGEVAPIEQLKTQNDEECVLHRSWCGIQRKKKKENSSACPSFSSAGVGVTAERTGMKSRGCSAVSEPTSGASSNGVYPPHEAEIASGSISRK